MRYIDAHNHFAGDHDDFVKLYEELDTKVMNICLAFSPKTWYEPKNAYRSMATARPDLFAWCTTFDPPDFTEADGTYTERVIAGLRDDLADGAVACKVWKNIGMEFKRPDGTYVLVDDLLFEPIFAELERLECPLLMHIAEPHEFWEPINPNSPHYPYLQEYPEWHAYARPDLPSHSRLMDARDRVLARHPKMRFVGAHLGSLEYDLGVLARTLDAHPNFMVDTSARIKDLAITQKPDDSHEFLEKYRDRVLHGTDRVVQTPQSKMDAATRAQHAAALRRDHNDHVRFFTTRDRFDFAGREIAGVGLRESSVQRIMHDNAARWYGL